MITICAQRTTTGLQIANIEYCVLKIHFTLNLGSILLTSLCFLVLLFTWWDGDGGGGRGGWRWDCITFVHCCPHKRKAKTSTPFVNPPKCNGDFKEQEVRTF